MATEDELPKELDKLEITPLLPQAKLLENNLAVQLNPFFENELKDTGPQIKVDQTANATQPTQNVDTRIVLTGNLNCRRCRYRRASESVLDELKLTSNTALNFAECTRTSPTGPLKQTLKKNSASVIGSGNRKILLRESVLKALKTCLHPHSNVRRKELASADTTSAATVSDNGSMTAKGMSDFRDLIDACRNLLAEDVDFSGRLNKISLSNRNSKNFTTIQTQKIKNSKLRRPILSTITTTASSPETTPSLLSSSITSTSTQQRNLPSEHGLSYARCSTTCSQQAGNSVAAVNCDDVTIDELASYFDTFVHIPKKMSSMAEMMYI